MSQEIFDSIDPSISGTDLAGILDDFKDALMTGLSGTSRPTELDQGGGWIDLTNDPTYWSYKIWTGTADVEVFRIYLADSIASVALAVEDFSVKKISADTVGSLLKLVKQRIANNGQVLSGDTVGEIQFIGRADDASNPVVAKMTWVASDDQTTSAYGGEFAFYSVADASSTLTKHLRFVDGEVETLVPLKVNSLRLVSANEPTATDIDQIFADTPVTEMTGSTATNIHSIDSTGLSKVMTIHNRSSANVTLVHQSTDPGAAATDRMKLPGSLDYTIVPDSSATLYYCDADSRWKLQSTADKNFFGFTVETFYGVANTWTAPAATTKARVRAYKRSKGLGDKAALLVDHYGNAYAWGLNANGQNGAGNVTPTSSPVAVLGGLSFVRVLGVTGSSGASRYAIHSNGAMYAWGINDSSQLGVAADVVPRSSPVAVLGGFRWVDMAAVEKTVFGITTNNILYAWGVNTNGQLGNGNVTLRSSPVAVLGGLRFGKVVPMSGASNAGAVVGLSTAGVAYAWGINTNGNLGVGDVTPRSSPVAVLGGLTFSDISGGAVSSRYFGVGLNTSGAAYAWGNNAQGQLGVGDTTPRSSPVAVVGGLTFKRLISHVESESVFGLTEDGALYGWGMNDQGQLGVGDTTNRSSPVAVLGGLSFSRVRLFKSAVFGITTSGALYAWGLNSNGQLGVGDVVSRSSPVAVLGGLTFSDVRVADGATDDYAIFGVQADGTLYAWGENANGTLALGDVTPRSSPVAVLGGFGPAVEEDTNTVFLTVVPSTAYTIAINPAASTFGSTPLGAEIYKVEVEYLE